MNIQAYINGLIAENYLTVKPVDRQTANKLYRHMKRCADREPYETEDFFLDCAVYHFGLLNQAEETAAGLAALDKGVRR